jgi:glucosylglycerate synthase
MAEVETPVAAPARAEVVVAVTSRNDERTVGGVVSCVRNGLAQFFGSNEARILLADARSNDGTREAARAAMAGATFMEIEPHAPATFTEIPYHGYPGRGRTLRAIFEEAQRLGANGCAVIGAGIQTAEPIWIERLIKPVLAGECDYVSPYYLRRVGDGAITKGIVYPMFRALYGARLRQPAAGEFGCSARLLTYFLAQDFWDAEHVDVGIDLWLAAAAVTGGFRACEAQLGPRTALVDTPVDLSTTLAQIVGALCADLEHRVSVWQRSRGSAAIPMSDPVPPAHVEAVVVDVQELIESFRFGYRELREIWTWVLPPKTIVELRRLTEMPAASFRFNDRLWAGIIYDFAVGYSFRVMPHDHLLRSLTPLYTGWLASFLNEMSDASVERADQRIEQLCLAFEAEKRHLIARWRWPERLR